MTIDLSKYKSKLFREDNTLVFQSEGLERSWSEFNFISQTKVVCEMFAGTYQIESFEDYCLNTLGKNSSTLDVFMTRQNEWQHSNVLREKYHKEYKKLMYVGFYKKYGIRAAVFRKIFNQIMRDIWEIKPYFSQFCYSKRFRIENFKKVGFLCIDENSVHLLHKNIELLNETKRNNQCNMIPFVFYSGMRTNELEKYFPKSLWKKLCENSFSKNRLISIKSKNDLCKLPEMQLKSIRKPSPSKENYINANNPIDLISYLNKLPSTILKLAHFEINNATLALANCYKLKDFRKEYNYKDGSFYRIIFDTIAELHKLNESYDLDWSKEQWTKKHEEVSQLKTPF
jgi:hypothetical protein